MGFFLFLFHLKEVLMVFLRHVLIASIFGGITKLNRVIQPSALDTAEAGSLGKFPAVALAPPRTTPKCPFCWQSCSNS
jgi:hypothetical protein